MLFRVGSLVPHGDSDGVSHGSASHVLGGEEVSGKVLIGLNLHVELAWLHVLELRMVVALLRDDLTTDKQDTGNFEVGLLTKHAHLTESVLAEVIETLKEALKKVHELVLNLTLLAELLVVQEPEGVALKIDLFHELLPALASLVGVVDVEGLEVEEIEGRRRKSLKWVHGLLLRLSILRLGSSSLLGGLLRLLLSLEDGLDALLGHADLAEDGDELGHAGDARKPGAALGGGLGEALVENELEVEGEASSEQDISNSQVATAKVVTSKGLIDGTGVLLDCLASIVEDRLSYLSVSAEDGVDGGSPSLHDARLPPVEPLVNLGALDGIGTEEGGVAGSKELADSLSLLKVALRGLEERELVSGVELLVALFGASLGAVDDDLDVLAVELSDDLASLDQDVANHLRVQLLLTKQGNPIKTLL